MSPKKEKMLSNEKISTKDSKQPTLPLDLVRSILERLSFVDFHRARCVSSLWYLASKESHNLTNPLLLHFPCKSNGSCELFHPRDLKTYIVRHHGFDFATSRCLASSGSWFLMLDKRTDFHLLNMFTRERIPLPSLESFVGKQMVFERISDSGFYVRLYYQASGNFSTCNNHNISIGKAVLWVDERSGDHLVVWNYDCFFAYHRRKDNRNSWKVFQPLKHVGCVDMVLKESKLYVLSLSRNITVFDFSTLGDDDDDDDDSPVECASFPSPVFNHHYNNLAVTLSGEVLIIASHVVKPCHKKCFFDVYKMDPKSSSWSVIKSIGDEVLLWDLGTTVAAKGAMSNCIYFSDDHSNIHNGHILRNENNCICVYHIETRKVLQRFSLPSVPLEDARWFLPTSSCKCML